MRKLVSIRRCNKVWPIPKADRLEAVQVGGWVTAVQKGAFAPGDLGVFFEIDAYLPVSDPRYDFFPLERMTFDGVVGIKVASRELRGQITQGLFLPLHQFPEIANPEEGQDVTDLLGIRKYEREIPSELVGLISGRAPGIVDDTALERIQNLPEAFEEWGELEFEPLLKLNGMSLSMFQFDGTFRICTKENELIDTPENKPWVLAREFDMPQALAKIGGNFAVQGELIGHNIGSNKERVPNKGHEFHIFNIWNCNTSQSLLPAERYEFVRELQGYGCGFKHVPRLGEPRKLKDFGANQQALIDLVTGPTVLYPGGRREGAVFRSMTTQDKFKVISDKFLLKGGD